MAGSIANEISDVQEKTENQTLNLDQVDKENNLTSEVVNEPGLASNNTSPNDGQDDKGKKKNMWWPPRGLLANYLALTIIVVLFYGTLVGLLDSLALPGGHIFGLFIIVVMCHIAGELITLLRLPSLLGMLTMGFMLRNVPKINFAEDLDPKWASDLRSVALVVILLRAGMGLDPRTLRKLSLVCFRLAFTPCLVETVTVAVASNLLLGFPWLWGFILGFVLAAVSPAVVVPSMLDLQDKKLGVNKGIPTLVIAAASIDDVLAITGFGVVLGITFSEGSVAWTVIKGPLEAMVGVAYGALFGFILWHVPAKDDKSLSILRSAALLIGGLFIMFGSRAVEFGGAGALGCLSLAFVAASGWRKQKWDDGIWDGDDNPVRTFFNYLWKIFQPILFGLIGAEIQVSQLEANTVGLGLAALGIGLFIRMVVTFLVVFKANLSISEQFFVALAWLPKATVQAAFGPVALDYARNTKAGPEMEAFGIKVLTIAVLAILVTAPLGAAAISLSAPRLLTPSPVNNKSSNDTEAQESV
ncbi:sodium/hydrogen exchanger 9B2-like isoform X2 [Tachypleus tridentatus]|uniref:sodium/hydrogen exchanger 9B2-like isoform X2 n=1 Tax=Tachypleus tridentatus TaxID=6853 RepID=UPI003FCFF26D